MATIHPNPIFEGMEKRVEIDFHLGDQLAGLRAIPRPVLDELMTLAACCIVSSRSNKSTDAYVLSESSLFITETKWILKTCGTTRLLNSVPRLLDIAAGLGMAPRRVKYSRATFLFPKLQPAPYTAFEAEVDFLQQHFGHLGPSGGAAAVLGNPTHGLQWHVYVADDQAPLPAAHQPTYNLEVCMTRLGAKEASQFFRSNVFVSAAHTTQSSGIAALKPGMLVDDYVFEPCGYSMNGIKDSGLMTIHITPEDHQSFASVEFSGSAADMPDPAMVLSQLKCIFAPGHMTVTLTVDHVKDADAAAWQVGGAVCPTGYMPTGPVHQYHVHGGKVSFLTLGDVAAQALGLRGACSPPARMLIRHASSFLSVGDMMQSSASLSSMAMSDGEGDSCSDGVSLPEDPDSGGEGLF